MLGVIALGTLHAQGQDLSLNDSGLSFVDTTDDWGRPWGDACSDFYRRMNQHLEILQKQGVARADTRFIVGVESSLQKVFRPKMWFKGSMQCEVNLNAARGEFEGFQLVVCPLATDELNQTYLQWDPKATFKPATVKIDAVEVSDLKQEKGRGVIPASAVKLYRVGYIRTVAPQYPVEHVGWWPDPLLPFEPFEVSNPNCQPIWADVQVPRDAPAGDYTGTITVRGPHSVQVEVRLHVWNFALPEKPSMMTMGWAEPAAAFKDGKFETFQRVLTPLLDHRLAPWHAAVRMSKNLDEHDKAFQWLLDRGVQLQAISSENPDPKYIEHLRQEGWLDRFICIPGDEPHEKDYPEYKKRADKIREAFPGLRVAMTEPPRPEAKGLFDLWIVEPSVQREEWIPDAQSRGESVWWYLCQLPINELFPGSVHRCPGVVVDRPAIDHRIIYWLAYKYRIEGVSFWAIASWPKGYEKWPQEPWPVNPISTYPYSGQHNANGFLCYPLGDELVPSIRLKCLRDGMEDYDYLTLLAARAGKKPSKQDANLLTVPEEVAVGLRYYNKDPSGIEQTRAMIARRLESR